MEIPTIEKISEAAAAQNFELRPNRTTFFLGRETLVPSKGKALSKLRRTVFRLNESQCRKRRGLFPATERSDRRNWLSG
jgi:K+ transporter